MKYGKPAKTLDEQAELLLSRGLVADKDRLVTVRSQINYYRLSTYLYTYRGGTESFLSGTRLKHILKLYEFYHTLRMLLLNAIEGVEILVRTRLPYHFRKEVALSLDQPEELVLSWLLSLNTVRNRCAHHARLWNWQLGVPVKLPKPRKYPEWSVPGLSNRYMGAILYVCSWCSGKLFFKGQWRQKARTALLAYSALDLSRVGMPRRWADDAIWN